MNTFLSMVALLSLILVVGCQPKTAEVAPGTKLETDSAKGLQPESMELQPTQAALDADKMVGSRAGN